MKPIKGATFQEKLDYDMAMWRSRGYHLDTRNAVTFEEDTDYDLAGCGGAMQPLDEVKVLKGTP